MLKKSKKIKLYLNHEVAHKFKAVVNRESYWTSFINGIVEFFFIVGSLVLEVCYLMGLILVYPFLSKQKPQKALRTKIVKTRVSLNERLNRLRRPYIKFGLVIFFGILLSQVVLFRSANFIAYGLELKGRVLGTATTGISHLGDAENSLKTQDIDGAQEQFNRAIQSFQQSQNDISQIGLLINQVLKVLPEKRDGDRLLEGAKHSAKAGLELTQFYSSINKIKLTPEGLTGDNVSQNFSDMSEHLEKGRQEIAAASELLSKVSEQSVPQENRLQFIQAKQLLQNANSALSSFVGIFDIAKGILLGNKNILVIFENNNELRPGGGFIGTYGGFVVSDGRIKSSKISSIYDLDGQLTENIAAPFPLQQVSVNWHMRDSNWFTNFPESAKKVISFYEKEGGETPELVIALTPSLVADLLKITGQVEIPSYKATLNSENFIEQTQIITSVTYDKNLNKPKQMLADFFPIFLHKLGSLTAPQSIDFLTTLQRNLLAKQIVFYSRNPEFQSKLSAYNWTGEIKKTDRDFLELSYANLGGTKTDLYIDQAVKLESNIAEDGSIVNTLNITRTSKLPIGKPYDNASFLRVYVPERSTLISTSGFGPMPIAPKNKGNLKNDPDVVTWESNAVKDLISDTVIGKESGKTFFGNWVYTPGGQEKTLTIKYKLPFSLKSVDHYSLLLQKQPGAVNQKVDYIVNFPGRALNWQNFTPGKLEANNFSTSLDLSKDYFLGNVLSLR